MSDAKVQEKIRTLVRERYEAIAEGRAGSSCCGPSGPHDSAEHLALVVGYSAQELSELPNGANLGLSCGNPLAQASLQEGEVVLDLGSGAGFDAFLAGRAVGPSGRVIGVDMTPAMLFKARALIAQYEERAGYSNVEFRLGEIEALPLADESVDVVISNCVLNLSPDKPRVWREIFRVLKKGGRAAISDLALREELPASAILDADTLVGCVSGAVLVEDTYKWAQQAGLSAIAVQYRNNYVDSLAKSDDPLYKSIVFSLPKGTTLGDYVASINLTASKLGAPCGGGEKGCCGA